MEHCNQSINQFTLPVYWAYQGSQLTGKSENADLEWIKSFKHLLLISHTTKKNTSLAGEALQDSCSKRVKERSSAYCLQKALISNNFWSYVKILTSNPDRSPRDSMSQKQGWTPVLCVLKVCYWVGLGYIDSSALPHSDHYKQVWSKGLIMQYQPGHAFYIGQCLTEADFASDLLRHRLKWQLLVYQTLAVYWLMK